MHTQAIPCNVLLSQAHRQPMKRVSTQSVLCSPSPAGGFYYPVVAVAGKGAGGKEAPGIKFTRHGGR